MKSMHFSTHIVSMVYVGRELLELSPPPNRCSILRQKYNQVIYLKTQLFFLRLLLKNLYFKTDGNQTAQNSFGISVSINLKFKKTYFWEYFVSIYNFKENQLPLFFLNLVHKSIKQFVERLSK